jgi:protein ImuB
MGTLGLLSTVELPLREAFIHEWRSADKKAPTTYSPLWLCIYLPKLALEVFDDPPAKTINPHMHHQKTGLVLPASNSPQAVLDEVHGRPIIHTVSPAAQSAGVVPSMPLAAAYALCPTLEVRKRDLNAETEQLKRLAAWAKQFTPIVSLEPPRALLLEIRGSLRLFGGLPRLQERLSRGLAGFDICFLMAVTPTPLASLLLVRNGHLDVIEREEALRSALGQLPTTGLPLSTHLIKQLARAGIRNLHDLWRLPRDGLARRFGLELLHYLDRVLGTLIDPRDIHGLPPCFATELALPEEITNQTSLLAVARHLIAQLCRYLHSRDMGATRLELELHHVRQPTTRITLGLRRSSRDEAHLLGLLEEHLNRIQLPAAVIKLGLHTKEIHPFTATNQTLFTQQRIFSDPAQRDQDWQCVMDQLQARLGTKHVRSLRICAEHRPECTWNYGQPTAPPTAPPHSSTHVRRPLWLLTKPQALPLRQGRPWRHGLLSLRTDPERIESGWWDGRDIRRDYYIATDTDGSRLWIFRDLSSNNAWYLHGYFG